MRYTNIIIALFTSLLLFSCSKEDELVQDPLLEYKDLTWEEPSPEELEPGSYATVKGFECGDEVTRSTWIFDSQKLVFGWTQHDMLGIFPTASIAKPVEGGQTWNEVNEGLLDPETQDNCHPLYTTDNKLCRTDPQTASVINFVIPNPKANSQTAQMFATNSDFEWDRNTRWTGYFPYYVKGMQGDPRYNEIRFLFQQDQEAGKEKIVQQQNGIPDVSALKKGTPGAAAGSQNPVYVASEVKACQHLGQFDVLISPETELEGGENPRINMQLRHVGAVARFYLAAPKNENLVVTNLKLICDKTIFYKAGKFTLKSHPYDANESRNYGVNLDLSSPDCQISPDEDTKTKMLQLDFVDGTATTEYDQNNAYKRYVTAYMMMYPITYNSATDGNLYAYVTAYRKDDAQKKEIHFVSNPLENKTMVSGKYYQWTSSTKLQDGLYPIELTATLLPWQDIVGGGIETDLTK